MDESSKPLVDATMRSDKNSSGIAATSTPTKRNNPYTEDGPDLSKRRKIEQSVQQSPVRTKHYFPIASLTLTSSCPEIKGTLTQVGDWITTRSQAKFLIFRLRDESGEIGGIVFDPMSPFFHQNFKLGATVIFEKAKVELSKAEYQAVTGPYRLVINRYCSVRIESGSPAPSQPIRKMIRTVQDSCNERDVVNILGIIENIGEMERNLMREIRIVDESEANIVLTLWEQAAINFNAPPGSVIAANKVAVRFFNSSKMLRTFRLSQLLIDPPIDDTQRLKKWYREWKAATEASENLNATTSIENTVHGITENTDDNYEIAIMDALTSTSTSNHQRQYILFQAIPEKPVTSLIDIMGQVIKVFDKRQFKTKMGTHYGREIALRDEDGSEIVAQIMGNEVLNNDIPCPSFVKIKNARRSLDGKRLLCGWDDLQIVHLASEIKQLSRFGRSESEEIQQQLSSISKTTATASLAAISRAENNFASSTIANNLSASAEAENTEFTAVYSPKASSKFTSGVLDNTLRRSDSSSLRFFTPISEINEKAVGGIKCNIVGLVIKHNPAELRNTRSGNAKWMRVIILADDKDCEIELSVWGIEVKDRDIPLYAVITAKNVMTREFNGITLSCLWAQLQIDPKIPEAVGLKKLIPYYSTSKETENSTIVGSSGVSNNSSNRSDSSSLLNFTPINEIKEKTESGFRYNIIGLVIKREEAKERQTKSGKSSWMRVVILADDKDCEIEMAIWGNEVKEHDIPLNSVITARDVTVREFNGGITLSCLWLKLKINPNITEAVGLRKLIAHYSAANETENPDIAQSSEVFCCSLESESSLSSYFIPIEALKEYAPSRFKYNTIGLVVKRKLVEERHSKDETSLWIRSVILADDKKYQIELVVCGDEVKEHDIPLNSVVVARNVAVRRRKSDITLSCLWENLQINPNIPQVVGLKELIPYYSTTNETQDSVCAGLSRAWDRSFDRVESLALVNFTPINEIKKPEAGFKYHIVGLVIKREPAEKRRTKARKSSWMRVVKLTDDKDCEIEIVVWGDEVKVHDIPLHSVITVRNVMVREFNGGLTLSCLWTHLQINPDIPQAVRLKKLIPYYSTTNEMQDVVCAGPSRAWDKSFERVGSLAFVNFTPINEIKKPEAGFKYHIVALVIKRAPAEERQTKAGKSSWMRELKLTDDKDCEIEMVVWGDEVKDHDIPLHSVITASNVMVREFNGGITLSCLWAHLQINPNIPQVVRLKKLIAYYSTTNETQDSVCAGPSKVCDNSSERGGSSALVNFTPIKEIKKPEAGFKYHIVGLVIKLEPSEERQTKAGKSSWMRVLILADDKDGEIEMAVWGDEVKDHDIPLHSVITASNVMVREFNGGITLSCLWAHLQINPNIPQVVRLKKLIAYYSTTNETQDSVCAGPSKVCDNSSERGGSSALVNFTPIKEIKKPEAGFKYHIVGLVIKLEPSEERQTKAGKSSWMRVLILADDKDGEIEIAVWGDEVKDHDIPLYSVITASNVMAREFNGGITLSCLWVQLQINPNIPQAVRLKKLIPYYSTTNEMQDLVCAGPSRAWDKSFERVGSLAFVNFTPINEIKKPEAGFKYHIVGLVIKLEPAEERQTKAGKSSWMRVLILADDKDVEIEMAVWGDEVKDHDIPLHSVITVRNVMVREFNGHITLSCLWAQLQINPNIPQAVRLKNLIAYYSTTNETQDSDSAGPSRVCDNSSERSGSSALVNFTLINELKNPEAGFKYHIVGLVIKLEPAEERQTKAGKSSWMRVLILADDKDVEIEMAVWGDEVKDHDIPLHSVITASNVMVREFDDGITLSCLWAQLQINPNIPQAVRLKKCIPYYLATSETQDSVFSRLLKANDNCSEQGGSSTLVNFTPINEIQNKREAGSKFNIVGIVIESEPAEERQTKAGKSAWMRVLVLADDKNCKVKMAVWGNEVKEHDIPLNTVITASNVTLREFNDDIILSCLWVNLQINPDIAQAARPKTLIDVHRCTPIKEIKANAMTDSKYNIAGVVIRLEPLTVQTTKAESISSTRVIIVADEQYSEIALTIWGNEVAEYDIPLHSVIIARNVKVRLFDNEKTLSCFWMFLEINPDIPQAAELRKLAANYKFEANIIDPPSTFASITEIQTKATNNSRWNIIGIVCKAKRIMSMDEQNNWVIQVVLKDDDYNSIEVAIWCEELFNTDIIAGSVLAVTDVKAIIFDDEITFNAGWDCVDIDPEIPEACRLKELQTQKWNTRLPNFGDHDEFADYTPIDVINRRKKGVSLNTIGLVVEVNPLEEREIMTRNVYMRKCVLRGKDRTEIVLNITSCPPNTFDIPMHSVIIASNATLQSHKDEEKPILVCRYVDVDFHVEVPESKGFKEAALNAPIQLENPVAPDPNNFTAIKDVTKTPLGSTFNILGVIVDMIRPSNVSQDKKKMDIKNVRSYTERVTLRDIDRQLITLIIRNTPVNDSCMKVNSVLATRDAILRMSGNDKVLWCLWDTVEINPKISEDKRRKFNNFARIPFVRNYMPLRTIARELSLIGCSMDIVGQVVEILPPTEVTFQGRTKRCGQYMLRNEIMMKLVIWEVDKLERSLKPGNKISVNTVVAANGATLSKFKGQILLNTNWRYVKINPKIPEGDRGAKCLAITRINTILEQAQSGDNLGILAIVTTPPTTICGSGMPIGYEELDQEDMALHWEPAREFVKLIDSSGEKIFMTMPFSMADTIRETENKTVVLLARNVQVCVHEGELELACTSTETSIEINPTIDEAKHLREWYDRVFKQKEENLEEEPDELSISPISEVLRNFADNSIASIMGILIKSEMRHVEKAGKRFQCRRIQVIDESEKVIDLLLWNSAAIEFNVPLYSVILVRDFRIYVKDEIKWGAFEYETDFIENPSNKENLQATLRLESWFTRFWPHLQKPIETGAAGNSIMEKNIEINENPMIPSNNNEVVETPMIPSNDNAMMENPIILSNNNEMVENSTSLSNDNEITENPNILSTDNEMTMNDPEEIKNDSRCFFGNNYCMSRTNDSILVPLGNNDAMDSDSESPDIFADC